MKKKRILKKRGAVKPQKISFSLFTLVLITFLSLSIVVFGSSFSPRNLPKKEVNADFGGVENVLRQTGEWEEGIKFGYFKNKIIKLPSSPLAFITLPRGVLSSTSGEEKWIEISLSEQKLRAYEGDRLIYEFPISSGLSWTPTVTGEFRIWYKTRWTRMTGGSVEAGNYYDLPNVPFNMFFYRDYALHGAYWHNNFGHQMSHGCVNLPIPASEQLFYWTDPVVPEGQGAVRSSGANPGTKVVVHS